MSRYGYRLPEIWELPVRAFWGLFRQISILNAEEDLRLLRVMQLAHAGDQDSLKGFITEKERLIDSAIIPNRELEHAEGRSALKRLAASLG